MNLARWLLGAALVFTGTAHLTFARDAFVAQVPSWLPLPVDVTVVASGVVEIALGLALLVLGRWRVEATAAPMSASSARATFACAAPVAGLSTGAVRPLDETAVAPSIQCVATERPVSVMGPVNGADATTAADKTAR